MHCAVLGGNRHKIKGKALQHDIVHQIMPKECLEGFVCLVLHRPASFIQKIQCVALKICFDLSVVNNYISIFAYKTNEYQQS